MYCSEGVAVLIPHEGKLKLRSCSILARGGGILDPLKFNGLYPPMYCSEGVAVLLPHQDRLKLRSYSIYWRGSFDSLLQEVYVGYYAHRNSF